MKVNIEGDPKEIAQALDEIKAGKKDGGGAANAGGGGDGVGVAKTAGAEWKGTAVDGLALPNLPCNIQIKSQSPFTVFIVMDSGRNGGDTEDKPKPGGGILRGKTLPAGGSRVFHPSVGDNPTYHVWTVDGAGNPVNHIYSDSFNTVRICGIPPLPCFCGDLIWTGGKLERD